MDYRGAILKKLMYRPKLRFTDMQLEDMSSKHFTYYLKKLLEEELITKKDSLYYLTDKGKDFVARLDEANMQYEKPPKISVAVFPERENNEGEKEILVNRRLKQPYYGKVGGFTGKVRFGESFEDTARRELLEEAGLTGDFSLVGIKRKFAYKMVDDEKKRVQDQIFVFFKAVNLDGDFKEKIADQENFWVKFDDVFDRDDLYNTYLGFLEYVVDAEKMDGFEFEVKAEGF